MSSACVGWECREISLAFQDITDQEISDARVCAVRDRLATQDQAKAMTSGECLLFCEGSIPQLP